jgi:hypothetical protein
MKKSCSFRECRFLQPTKPPRVEDAKSRFEFGISDFDIVEAQDLFKKTSKNKKGTVEGCDHPAACVVAQAIMNSMPNGITCMVQVGKATTKIYVAGPNSEHVELITRYNTPKKLATAISAFDKTGLWGLEPGRYYLLPYSGVNRHKYMKKNDGVEKKPASRFRASSTRRVLRLDNKLKRIV